MNIGQKLYTVCVPLHASITVMVAARNEEEAIEMALDHAKPPHLCDRCSADLAIGEVDTGAEIEAIEIDQSRREPHDQGGQHGSAHSFGPA